MGAGQHSFDLNLCPLCAYLWRNFDLSKPVNHRQVFIFLFCKFIFVWFFFYKLFGAKSRFVSIVVQNTYLIYIVFYSNNIPMLNKILNLITCSQ